MLLLERYCNAKEQLNKWIGGAGVVIGTVTIYAGPDVSYRGFSGLRLKLGSLIIYFIWIKIIGGFMWKKSMSMLKTNQKALGIIFFPSTAIKEIKTKMWMKF